ncbi:MAG: hypothetical protein ACRDTA_14080 [Pseudonocardiaceae bacterium]
MQAGDNPKYLPQAQYLQWSSDDRGVADQAHRRRRLYFFTGH